MTPFKPNTPNPNLNFEHTKTPLGVASSPNPHLPGPKVYRFTSVNQCLPMMQRISSSPKPTLKLPALLSFIICDALAYSCTLAPLTRMAHAR
jgi:hypothetical protein